MPKNNDDCEPVFKRPALQFYRTMAQKKTHPILPGGRSTLTQRLSTHLKIFSTMSRIAGNRSHYWERSPSMNEEDLRKIVAKNISYYRRQHGQTQAELAAALHYSDKSVSKWERGDGLPDVYILTLIAQLYGVTVGDLLSESPPPPQQPKEPARIMVTLLSCGLVWLVATITYAALRLFSDTPLPRCWLAFCYGIPVTGIVLVVFTSLWWGLIAQGLSVSVLVWSIALCVRLSVQVEGIDLIWTIAAAVQILVILWYLYRGRVWRKFKRKK